MWAATGCTTGDEESSSPSQREDSPDTSPTSQTGDTAPTTEARALTPADFEGLGTCVLLPEMTAGPFPTLQQMERRDITEGYPGRPLRLGLRAVDEDCSAIPRALVEVWHADASGDYSAYEDGGTGKDEASGTTFLRGYQVADGDGIVEFDTIYPGWYRERAVHVHVRVHRDDAMILTSQLFFPDDLTAEVFSSGVYDEFGLPDTTNATDGLGGDIATNGSLLHVMASGAGQEPPLVALLNIGVTT